MQWNKINHLTAECKLCPAASDWTHTQLQWKWRWMQICYQNHLCMQLWNRNSFKQIYQTVSRKTANHCIWVQRTLLASCHITHEVSNPGDSTGCQSPWTGSWTMVELSTITRRRSGSVTQCGEVEKGSTLCKCPLTFGTNNRQPNI